MITHAFEYVFINFYGRKFREPRSILHPGNRGYYGITHAIGCADLVLKINEMYQDYIVDYSNAMTDIANVFNISTEELLSLIQVAALFQDTGCEGDDVNCEEAISAGHLYDFLMIQETPINLAKMIGLVIACKNNPQAFVNGCAGIDELNTIHIEQQDYLRQLINMADGLEVIRMQEEFKCGDLPVTRIDKRKIKALEPLSRNIDELLSEVLDTMHAERFYCHRMNRKIIRVDESEYSLNYTKSNIELSPDVDKHTFEAACLRYGVDLKKFESFSLFAALRKEFKGIIRGVSNTSMQSFEYKVCNSDKYYKQNPNYLRGDVKGHFSDPFNYLQTEDVALLVADYQNRNVNKPGYDVNNIFVIENLTLELYETKTLLEQFNKMQEGDNLKLIVKVAKTPTTYGLHYTFLYIRKVDDQIKILVHDAVAGVFYEHRDGLGKLTSIVLDWAKQYHSKTADPMLIKTSTLTQNDWHNCIIFALKAMKYVVKYGGTVFQSIQSDDLVSGQNKIIDQSMSEIYHLKANSLPAPLAKLTGYQTFRHISKIYQREPVFKKPLPSIYYKETVEPIAVADALSSIDKLFTRQENEIVSVKQGKTLLDYSQRISSAECKLLAYRKKLYQLNKKTRVFNDLQNEVSSLREKLQELILKGDKYANYMDVALFAKKFDYILQYAEQSFFTNPTVENVLEFKQICQKGIDNVEFEFNKRRGNWDCISPIIKKILGILALLTVIPAIIIATVAPNGFEGTFFKQHETDSMKKLNAFKAALEKVTPEQMDSIAAYPQ